MPNKNWKYTEDYGTMMAECSACGGRMIIDQYQYHNPYHYCPYCGEKMGEPGNFRAVYDRVYNEREPIWTKVNGKYVAMSEEEYHHKQLQLPLGKKEKK